MRVMPEVRQLRAGRSERGGWSPICGALAADLLGGGATATQWRREADPAGLLPVSRWATVSAGCVTAREQTVSCPARSCAKGRGVGRFRHGPRGTDWRESAVWPDHVAYFKVLLNPARREQLPDSSRGRARDPRAPPGGPCCACATRPGAGLLQKTRSWVVTRDQF
jgi:hypothetical protein